MTLQVNGDDIMAFVHVARIVGSIVMMLIVGLVIWWAVRPSRRARESRDPIENDSGDTEEMWRLMDRMEDRLEVLERAMADQVEPPRVRGPRQDRTLAPADEDRESGRTE